VRAIESARLGLFSILVTAIAVLLGVFSPAASAVEFGLEKFGGEVVKQNGDPATAAGAHPFRAAVSFRVFEEADASVPSGGLKDAVVELPPGFVGNPTAVPACTHERLVDVLQGFGLGIACPDASAVGTMTLDVYGSLPVPLYNVVPPRGVPAQLGFMWQGVPVYLDAKVLYRDGAYRVVVGSENISQAVPTKEASVSLWGVPADPAHESERGLCAYVGGACPVSVGAPRPYLSNPGDCAAGPLTTSLRISSWLAPSSFIAASFDHDLNGNPMAVDDCRSVPFQPRLTARPTSREADSPTGLDVSLSIPQQGLENAVGIASAHLKRAKVTLPEGMTVNPASAAGLGACSLEQIGIDSEGEPDNQPVRCPHSAKIGTVTATTPVLAEPLSGDVYLAAQGRNPFGSLLALYLVVRNEERGILVKLPGRVDVDPGSGRLTATFDDNPQLPVSSLDLDFKSGARAPLVNPPACGTYTTDIELTSWSGQVRQLTDSFQVGQGPGGGPCPQRRFDPRLSAGTANPLAGAYSPFLMRLTREDGSDRLAALDLTLPEGLLGRLRGIPYCPESALATVAGAEGSGAGQIATPSCPAASQLGSVSVGAGAGPSPFYVDTGRAYLAGPYKGAPLSVAFVAPAVAGPFDLGSVLVRAALRVDPASARITAVSDPLPTILHGIPLDLRDVRIALDRPEFTLNPTSCDPMGFSGSASSPSGASAPLAERFQVGSCAGLRFEPSLRLRLSGGTRRAAHPKLRATLTMPEGGGANIAKAVVTMPRTELLENAHIRTICTRVQYAAKACPPGSVYGYAKAWTPLLDKPLEGPVYLRSSNHELPDLVASLDGQIHIDLPGRIDSVNARIRNTFWAVPDAPVSRFVLTMQGGKKGLLANKTDLCKASPRARVQFDGQNGKPADSNPLVRLDCGAAKRKAR
jgi:hypothetical protein